ncbi:protein-L-isoaspartate O-methyltransferase family protein [Nesterenkonia suensis]
MTESVAADAVARAMEEVPRADFLPGPQRRFAAADEPLAIGHGQTNSQPSTVARMLRLLDVRPGQRVLDVGSGSGWSAGLLGRLVGPQGEVFGVELIPELVLRAQEALTEQQMPWVQVRQAQQNVLGLPEAAPFGRILVSADAPQTPYELIDQLDDDGVLVVPVVGEMLRICRTAEGVEATVHGQYRFVPLR